MNTLTQTEMDPTLTAGLAERVRQHLGEEEQSLIGVLDAVRQLHQSLRQLDGESLAQALQNETDALRAAERLQQRRQQIRADAAGELGIDPQQATLELLAGKSTVELRQTILASRQKLAEMSAEMDRLNRQNAAMIQQSLMLMRGIVGRLTGAAPGESYNAGGVREEAHVGSLVQWGG